MSRTFLGNRRHGAVLSPSEHGGDRDPIGTPPAIGRVPSAEGRRPFWSVMVPVFNCPAGYLRETLLSVLVQDPGVDDMQIEVVDNCSTTGDAQAVVRELADERIEYHRQPRNVGISENFNSCIRRARGHWVHILHGDDTVRPEFYARLRAGIAGHPEASAALCRVIYMDEGGHWTGLSELEAREPAMLGADFTGRQFVEQRVQFVAVVVRRSTYEELGGFRSALAHCLDWDMWKRIAASRPIYYDPAPMACCRLHAAAESSRVMETGDNVRYERMSIASSSVILPPAEATLIGRRALEAAGVRAVRRAVRLWQSGERRVAWRQFREGIRCSQAPAVMARSAYFLLRTIVR